MKKIKALILLSGGLDSILAAKILRDQGIEVLALGFESYFFNAKNAIMAAKNLKIPIKIIDFSKEHLNLVKNPKHGYGKSMNPCIDCHILMLKKAKEIMDKEKYDSAPELSARYGASFVATGEVLGERPMSQHKAALNLIEKESGLSGFLLRPLSAKLLKPTIPETKGLISRERFFDISGRSRKKQIAMAKNREINWYPTPSGGCLLTDLIFGEKLQWLLENFSDCAKNDIELLKIGRHFTFKKIKIIVGRNHQENLKIKKLAKRKDILIEMKNYPGPATLIRNYGETKIPLGVVKKAQFLTQNYSLKARNKKDVEFSKD